MCTLRKNQQARRLSGRKLETVGIPAHSATNRVLSHPGGVAGSHDVYLSMRVLTALSCIFGPLHVTFPWVKCAKTRSHFYLGARVTHEGDRMIETRFRSTPRCLFNRSGLGETMRLLVSILEGP